MLHNMVFIILIYRIIPKFNSISDSRPTPPLMHELLLREIFRQNLSFYHPDFYRGAVCRDFAAGEVNPINLFDNGRLIWLNILTALKVGCG